MPLRTSPRQVLARLLVPVIPVAVVAVIMASHHGPGDPLAPGEYPRG